MTRDEAEQALEIARAALREVGEDPASIWVTSFGVHCNLSGPGLATPEGYRAVVLGGSTVVPSDGGVYCFHHCANWHQVWECQLVTCGEALAGRSTCEAVTA